MAAGRRHRASGGLGATRRPWFYRTLFDLLPLDAVADWPVYVSLAEARAFARWRGERLPTEAEFQRAAFGEPDRASPASVGRRAARRERGNLRLPPVGARRRSGTHPAGASAWGVQDLIGDGWEWTDTIFAGLPGFTPISRATRATRPTSSTASTTC